MIEPDLLSILCCPETHQPFRVADDTVVQRINTEIAAGKLSNRAGKPVTEKIDGGLIRDDGRFLYPIRGGIPILLVDEALPMT